MSEVSMQKSKNSVAMERQRYVSPNLRIFGRISDFTLSAAGTCQDDGNNACASGSMRMG